MSAGGHPHARAFAYCIRLRWPAWWGLSPHALRGREIRSIFRIGNYYSVEAKNSDDSPTDALRDYQKALGAAHAFQVVRNAPFAAFDCFAEHGPVSVPALTFLSQLL